MNNPKRKPHRNAQLAIEYLLGHPTASNEDIVKATGISPRSVSRARSMLIATGKIQRSYYDRQHRTTGPNEEPLEEGAELAPDSPVSDLPLVGPRDPSALENALRADHGPPMTTEQMKQRYSAIARYGAKTGEFTLEIQAMQALGRLDASTGARNRLGPGAPHTREERRDRVVPIMQAAGPSVTAESATIAYSKGDFALFLEHIGRFMAKKGENERLIAENSAPEGDSGTPGDQIPHEAVATAEVGPGDVPDRGEAGPTGGAA